MILCIYKLQGRDRQPFGDKILMSTEIPYLLAHLLTVLKKNLLEIYFFFTFFMCFFFFFFHMFIAPGRGRQPIGDKKFMTTERPFLFVHMLQVSNWSLWNLILYTFLMILYMYIAPGQGQKTLGDKLLMSVESP